MTDIDEQVDGPDDYLELVKKKRRKLVIAVVAVGAVGGVAVGLALLLNHLSLQKRMADAKSLVNDSKVTFLASVSNASGEMEMKDAYRTYVARLKELRRNADYTVEVECLAEHTLYLELRDGLKGLHECERAAKASPPSACDVCTELCTNLPLLVDSGFHKIIAETNVEAEYSGVAEMCETYTNHSLLHRFQHPAGGVLDERRVRDCRSSLLGAEAYELETVDDLIAYNKRVCHKFLDVSEEAVSLP